MFPVKKVPILSLPGRVFLGLMLLLVCEPAGAQGSAVIEGYVRDRHGKVVSGVVVVLKGSGGVPVDRTHTDHEGHYIFSQIGSGIFFVSVEPEGGNSTESRMVQFQREETDPHRREDFVLDSVGGGLATGALNEPLFIQQVPLEAEQVYQKGVENLKNNRRDAALADFEGSVIKFPTYFAALRNIGLEYMQRGDAVKAGNACQRAVAVNKNSSSTRFCLGWAYYQAEKLDDASRELNEAAKLNPRAAESYWFLGMTEVERKQWAAAEQAFLSFGKLHPQNDRPLLHLYLTSVYDSLGRPREAARSLETYLKAVPEKDRTAKLKQLLAQLRRKAT